MSRRRHLLQRPHHAAHSGSASSRSSRHPPDPRAGSTPQGHGGHRALGHNLQAATLCRYALVASHGRRASLCDRFRAGGGARFPRRACARAVRVAAHSSASLGLAYRRWSECWQIRPPRIRGARRWPRALASVAFAERSPGGDLVRPADRNRQPHSDQLDLPCRRARSSRSAPGVPDEARHRGW